MWKRHFQVATLICTIGAATAGAQIRERIRIVGGSMPTRSSTGSQVDVRFKSPHACFALMKPNNEVIQEDCLQICSEAGRSVFLLKQGTLLRLGSLDGSGKLTLDPEVLSREGKLGSESAITDLAAFSEVDLRGCKLTVDQWQQNMTPEERLQILRSRARALEEDPRKFRTIWRELERRANR